MTPIRRSAAYRNLEANDDTVTDYRTGVITIRLKQCAAVACAILVIVLASGVERERITPTESEREAVRVEHNQYLDSINQNREALLERIYQGANDRKAN